MRQLISHVPLGAKCGFKLFAEGISDNDLKRLEWAVEGFRNSHGPMVQVQGLFQIPRHFLAIACKPFGRELLLKLGEAGGGDWKFHLER